LTTTEAEGAAMTKLGATIESVEALGFAQAMVSRAHSKDANGDSMFEAAESRVFVRGLLRNMLLTVDGRLDLLDLARAGEEDAQIILRTEILERRSRDLPMPAEFVGYEMELIRGTIVPQSGPGRDKRNFLLRDVSIAATVAAVCDRYGLRPTGRSARRRSGCAIVSQALAIIGHAVGVEAVEVAWNRYKRAMPRGCGWTFALEDKALPS
jgi:hypothetical protein